MPNFDKLRHIIGVRQCSESAYLIFMFVIEGAVIEANIKLTIYENILNNCGMYGTV